MRGLTLAAVIGFVITAATQAGAAEFHASVSPAVLEGKPPWRLTYQVEVDSGPQGERIEVVAPGQLEITGAASVTAGSPFYADYVLPPNCPTPIRSLPSSFFDSDTLDLPPSSQTFIRFAHVVAWYPTLGVSLGTIVDAFSLGPDDSSVLLPKIAVPGPRVAVPATLPMGLAKPQLLAALPDRYERAAYRLTGWADAAAAGSIAELRYTATDVEKGRSVLIARQRIGPKGHFSTVWRPPWGGDYTLAVHYRRQDARFVTSEGECTVRLKAQGPDPAFARGATIRNQGHLIHPKLGAACLPPTGSVVPVCVGKRLNAPPTRRRLTVQCGSNLRISTGVAARRVAVRLLRVRHARVETRRVLHARPQGRSRHDWKVTVPPVSRFNVVSVSVEYPSGRATFNASALPRPRCSR
jgi:hypothetical protein